MTLTIEELKSIYDTIIVPFGHPDPIGYVVRAVLTSDADPDYFGLDGKIGFMPVTPEYAKEIIGDPNITGLQNNIMNTIMMDLFFFDKYASVDSMIVAFHFGEDEVQDVLSSTVNRFLKDVDDSRLEMIELLKPPRATVHDVMSMIMDYYDHKDAIPEVKQVITQMLTK